MPRNQCVLNRKLYRNVRTGLDPGNLGNGRADKDILFISGRSYLSWMEDRATRKLRLEYFAVKHFSDKVAVAWQLLHLSPHWVTSFNGCKWSHCACCTEETEPGLSYSLPACYGKKEDEGIINGLGCKLPQWKMSQEEPVRQYQARWQIPVRAQRDSWVELTRK